MSEAAFERGLKEGRIDAKLDEHSRHLAAVNGSIERSATALESVAKEVRDLRVAFDTQVKTAEAATKALANETERRREALAVSVSAGDQTFSRRHALAGLMVSAGAVLLTFWLARH